LNQEIADAQRDTKVLVDDFLNSVNELLTDINMFDSQYEFRLAEV
jgi:hypothetical protein